MFPEVLERFLLACMRSPEMRLVVDGATGAGKTTLVRALLGSLDPLVQVAIIEDTAEIDLYDEVLHPNVESWEERLPNNEGEGGISQGALVKHALRYRPEWLVLGEVRDSDAAVPMLKAMTHGQSSLTTVHAHSAVAALDKLALYLGTVRTGSRSIPPIISCRRRSTSWFTWTVARTVTGTSLRWRRSQGSTTVDARPTRSTRRAAGGAHDAAGEHAARRAAGGGGVRRNRARWGLAGTGSTRMVVR